MRSDVGAYILAHKYVDISLIVTGLWKEYHEILISLNFTYYY